MILPDKRPEQRDFVNFTDYSLERPQGTKSFFTFIRFTDETYCMWANIFTYSRKMAMMLVLEKFCDCLDYIDSINIHECYN